MILNPCVFIFKMIKQYVNFNQSEKAENLQKLFEQSQNKKTNGYTYYGIQKYIKPHLIYS